MSDILEELKTPIAYKTQILVVGGGTAGWAAAVCAARHGSNVLLIERNYELGGTSTTGMMHLFGSTMQNMHGLMKEIILNLSAAREVKVGPLSPFDGQAYTQLIFDMINQSGAKLLLGVTFSRTIVEGRCVKGVVIETKSGRQAIMADVVIDATGDGDVCASAGAEFVMGRTNDNKMRPHFTVISHRKRPYGCSDSMG